MRQISKETKRDFDELNALIKNIFYVNSHKMSWSFAFPLINFIGSNHSSSVVRLTLQSISILLNLFS